MTAKGKRGMTFEELRVAHANNMLIELPDGKRVTIAEFLAPYRAIPADKTKATECPKPKTK